MVQSKYLLLNRAGYAGELHHFQNWQSANKPLIARVDQSVLMAVDLRYRPIKFPSYELTYFS